jgi:hypothetical protein
MHDKYRYGEKFEWEDGTSGKDLDELEKVVGQKGFGLCELWIESCRMQALDLCSLVLYMFITLLHNIRDVTEPLAFIHPKWKDVLRLIPKKTRNKRWALKDLKMYNIKDPSQYEFTV